MFYRPEKHVQLLVIHLIKKLIVQHDLFKNYPIQALGVIALTVIFKDLINWCFSI
jgi:hypothetical protein